MQKYYMISFDQEEDYVNAFLDLPGRLYGKKELMQNVGEEKKLLLGIHPLSKYFKTYHFLVRDVETETIVSRATITTYPNEAEVAYFGFFESEDIQDAVKCLFDGLSGWAAEHAYKRLVGPVNASFWLGYRLKTDHFDTPYAGEPYNKPYYQRLLEYVGFGITDELSLIQQ